MHALLNGIIGDFIHSVFIAGKDMVSKQTSQMEKIKAGKYAMQQECDMHMVARTRYVFITIELLKVAPSHVKIHNV